MRKVISKLSAEERDSLLYLVDFGAAVSCSALVVCLLRLFGDLI